MRIADKLAAEKESIERTEYWHLFINRLIIAKSKKESFCSTQIVTLGNMGRFGQEQGRASAYREVLDIWDKILQDAEKERK
jgi:hypothetical protein